MRGKSFINRIEAYLLFLCRSEYKQMKEYILNLRALDLCLALHEEQYQRVLELASDLKKENQLSSKIRRRVAGAVITALRKLCRHKEALAAIDQECEALESDPEVN